MVGKWSCSVLRYRCAVHDPSAPSSRDWQWQERGTGLCRTLELHVLREHVTVTRGTQPLERARLSEVGVVVRGRQLLFVVSASSQQQQQQRPSQSQLRRFVLELASVGDVQQCVTHIRRASAAIVNTANTQTATDRAARRAVRPPQPSCRVRGKKRTKPARAHALQQASSSSAVPPASRAAPSAAAAVAPPAAAVAPPPAAAAAAAAAAPGAPDTQRNLIGRVCMADAVSVATKVADTAALFASVASSQTISSDQVASYLATCLQDKTFANFACELAALLR